MIAWGGLGFGIAPILQTYTTTAAPRTPEIASSLTVSAFNLGIAGGAYVGGQVINTLGIHAVTWVGALAVAAALPLAALKQTQHPSAAVPAKAEPTTSPL